MRKGYGVSFGLLALDVLRDSELVKNASETSLNLNGPDLRLAAKSYRQMSHAHCDKARPSGLY